MGHRAGASQLGASILLAGVLAVGTTFAIGSSPESWGARAVPLLAGGAMIATGFAIAFEQPRQDTPDTNRRPGWGAEAGVFGLILLATLYIFLMPRVGYLLSTALATPVAFRLFGVRSASSLVIATIACPLALHVFFFRILGVFPPFGTWFDLTDHVPL